MTIALVWQTDTGAHIKGQMPRNEALVKTAQIKAGKKDGLLYSVPRPETAAEWLKVSGNDVALVDSWTWRGFAIYLQDRVGRPERANGAKQEAVQAALDKFLAALAKGEKPKGAGRPPKQKIVTLPKNWEKMTAAQQTEYLTKQGLTVIQQ